MLFILIVAYLLGRTIAQFEKDIDPLEAEMEHWKMNMAVLDKKETQYVQENSNYKVTTHLYMIVAIIWFGLFVLHS